MTDTLIKIIQRRWPSQRVQLDDGSVILSLDDVHRRRMLMISLLAFAATVAVTIAQLIFVGFSQSGPFNITTATFALLICVFGFHTACFSEKTGLSIWISILAFAGLLWAEVAMGGGLTGYHAPILPVLALIAALLMNTRDTLIFMLLNLAATAALAYLTLGTELLPAFTIEPQNDTIMSGIMLATVIAGCGGTAVMMSHQNSRIDNQLRDLVYHQQHVASHDHLSGLGNRNRMQDYFETLGEADAMDVLLIDLDGFKGVNDTYGHNAGDYLIKAFSDRLREITGDEDILIRLGGDEFVVLLPGGITPTAQVRQYGTQLIDLISRPYPWKGHVLRIGASIGHARYPQHNTSPSKVLSMADKALYVAKNMGKGMCVTYGVRPTQAPVKKAKPRVARRKVAS
ncbi:MAG: GGDEF domain-containing protein [Pseudomonadota bacterium]